MKDNDTVKRDNRFSIRNPAGSIAMMLSDLIQGVKKPKVRPFIMTVTGKHSEGHKGQFRKAVAKRRRLNRIARLSRRVNRRA